MLKKEINSYVYFNNDSKEIKFKINPLSSVDEIPAALTLFMFKMLLYL